MTNTNHAQLSVPGCADALTDEDIKIGASDFEYSHSEPEESEYDREEYNPYESDAEVSKPEESDLEESEPEESEIQALIRAEYERFEKRRRAEQEMTYRMFPRVPFRYRPVEVRAGGVRAGGRIGRACGEATPPGARIDR